jgi:uncharacterized protein YjbJ (UPF0337 family)
MLGEFNSHNQCKELDMVDRDRTAGTTKEWTGGMKEKAGGFIGDEKMKREGQAEKTGGKIQNAVGSAKDAIRDTFSSDKR